MITSENMEVVQHKEIARKIYQLVLQGELVREIQSPGQFVNVKVGEGADPLLPRPISIAEIDYDQNQLTIIYRVEGFGTEVLAKKQIGETVNIIGPLGNGFPLDLEENTTALLVGGGIGTPPLYELSKQLVKKGVHVIHVMGFQQNLPLFLKMNLVD